VRLWGGLVLSIGLLICGWTVAQKPGRIRYAAARHFAYDGYMTWPLVGRASILRDLNRVLERSLPAGVVIGGDAGVGKTRLLTEFADDAAAAGWAVEWVTGAVSTASVPMGALARLVPDQVPVTQDPVQFVVAMRQALLDRYEGQRLLLAVDDAPRLDPASGSFVAQLAAMGYCLVVCTARSGESLPSPIEALIKDEIMDQVELGPLLDSDIETLIRSDLDGQVDPAMIARGVQLVEGNPLFLRMLLADGVESGSLRMVEGRWVFEEPIGVSTGLGRLVAGRMGRFSDAERTALEVMTVAEPLDLKMADAFFEDDSLEDLERRGVVRIVIQGRRHVVELVHPLFGETIRAETPVTRRRSIAGDLLRAGIATGARRSGDPLRLAMWHLESGEPIDGETLLEAAQFANIASDHHLAERIARSLFEGKGDFRAGLELGEAVSRQGRSDEAEGLFAELASISDSDQQRSALVMRRADNAFFRAGDRDRATALLDETRTNVNDPASRLMLDSQRILMLAFKPDPKSAFTEAVELINHEGVPDEAVLGVTTVLGLVATWLGDSPMVYQTTEDGLKLIETAGYAVPDATARLLGNQIISQVYDGRVEEAVRGSRDGYQQAITPPIDDFSHIWAIHLGMALAVRGQVQDAVAAGRSACMLADRSDVMGHSAGVAGNLAVIAGQARDKVTVEFALRKLGAASVPVPPVGFWMPRARAWQQALTGDIQQATRLATTAGEAAIDDGMPMVAAWALYDTVLFGKPPHVVVEKLQQIAACTSAVTINAYAEHASALEAGDPQAVEKVAAGFQGRSELLYAVTAYLQSARLYRDHNMNHAATRAATKARQLDTQLPTQVFWDTPSGLTRRETEISTLAAQGLTSRQIADRLYVSVRTVNNHLATAYTKLGVHSRDELAGVVSPSSGN
jgi:DNA-binding NarL/FixJ family response regulator